MILIISGGKSTGETDPKSEALYRGSVFQQMIALKYIGIK